MEHLWITILDNPHLDICQPRLKRNMFTLVQDKMEQLSKSPDGSSTGSFFRVAASPLPRSRPVPCGETLCFRDALCVPHRNARQKRPCSSGHLWRMEGLKPQPLLIGEGLAHRHALNPCRLEWTRQECARHLVCPLGGHK